MQRRITKVPVRGNTGRLYNVDLQQTSRERIRVFIDQVRMTLQPGGWGTINLIESDILMGATRQKAGTATAGYIHNWCLAGWIEVQRPGPHSKTVDVRWTYKGMKAFEAVGCSVPYEPIVSPTLTAREIIERERAESEAATRQVRNDTRAAFGLEPESDGVAIRRLRAEARATAGLGPDPLFPDDPTPAETAGVAHVSRYPLITQLIVELGQVLADATRPKPPNNDDLLREIEELRAFKQRILGVLNED